MTYFKDIFVSKERRKYFFSYLGLSKFLNFFLDFFKLEVLDSAGAIFRSLSTSTRLYTN